jgi:hypothetical protein
VTREGTFRLRLGARSVLGSSATPSSSPSTPSSHHLIAPSTCPHRHSLVGCEWASSPPLVVSLCSSFLSFVLLGFVRQQLLTCCASISLLRPQQRHPLLRPVARDCPSPITNLLLSVSQSLVTRHLAFEFDHSNTLLFVCLEKANPKAWPNYQKPSSNALASPALHLCCASSGRRLAAISSSSAAPSFDWYIYPV